MIEGYNESFLGEDHIIPLPNFSPELEEDVLETNTLRDGYIADYPHYSLCMSKSNKQALFSAANIDLSKLKTIEGKRIWFADHRIGVDNQILNYAYKNNHWDRGHLTRRYIISWGGDLEATSASNKSYSYANASMQHEDFNRDEWKVPESFVEKFKKSKDNKLCVFTGPIFTKIDLFYSRGSKSLVRIPAGFWKIVAYIDKCSSEIACQAYEAYQYGEFIVNGKKTELHPNALQVTTSHIENFTNLQFPDELYHSNPLYFKKRKTVNNGPEFFTIPAKPSDLKSEYDIIVDRDNIKKNDKRSNTMSEDKYNKMLESLNSDPDATYVSLVEARER